MTTASSTNKLIFDMSSNEYHGEKNTFSSSQLKTMLQDPEIFYKKYITKEIPKDESPAFDVGTYFHCAILEPEKLNDECAVFSEGIRRGPKWEAFKELHKGKAIITKNELEQAETLIKAINNSPRSMEYLNGSSVEVSAFVKVYVLGSDVYTMIGSGLQKLTINGWEFCDSITVDLLEEFAVQLTIKVRADSIRIGEGIISDLKSTTGNCLDEHSIRQKVADYYYSLSASLYLDMFTAATSTVYHTFVWLFSSKNVGNAKAWIQSEKNKQVGRKKYKDALVLLAKYISNDWAFSDEVSSCDPQFYDLQLLNKEF